jgi:nicotinamidase-related amidase
VLLSQFVNTEHSNFTRFLGWDKLFESPEIDIAPELEKFVSEDTLFRKDTYSAFASQKLLSYLKKNSIEELDFCGIDLEGCVLASAYHAFDLGFRPRILMELSRSTGAQKMDTAAEKIIERNLVKGK